MLRNKVSRAMVAGLLLMPTLGRASEDASAAGAMSFFDYLGTMVEEDGVWMDPLLLEEVGLAEDDAVEVGAQPAEAAESVERKEELP